MIFLIFITLLQLMSYEFTRGFPQGRSASGINFSRRYFSISISKNYLFNNNSVLQFMIGINAAQLWSSLKRGFTPTSVLSNNWKKRIFHQRINQKQHHFVVKLFFIIIINDGMNFRRDLYLAVEPPFDLIFPTQPYY